ncbi:MAG: hypothetical protein V1735_00840 [Nanoarchaeota archaeon]
MDKKPIAMLLISLVLVIPIYSAQVWAYYLGNVKVYGQDEREGFLRGEDSLTITFRARHDTVDVATDMSVLKIGPANSNPQEFSGECEPFRDGYADCTYYEDSERNWRSPWRIILCRASDDCSGDGALLIESVSWDTDAEAPEISPLTLDKQVYGKENITVDFPATDLPAGACSGIASVTVNFDNQSSGQTFLPTGNDCAYSNETKLEAWSLVDGTHYLCAYAVDRLGNRANATCQPFYSDRTNPSNCQLKLVNANGQEVQWTNGQPAQLYLRASFIEAGVGIDPAHTYASFSLNDQVQNISSPSCVNASSNVNCTFQLPWPISEESTISADVRLVDQVGNMLPSCPASFSVSLDAEGPAVADFTTSAHGYYGPKRNVTVTADLSDSGAGIDPTTVKAKLPGLYIGNTEVSAMTPWTSRNGDIYSWEGVHCRNSCPDEVNAELEASDLTGTDLRDTANFLVDDTPPEILPIEIDGELHDFDVYTGDAENPNREVFKGHDLLHLVVNANDTAGDVVLQANFSALTGVRRDIKNVPCAQNQDSTYTCDLSFTPILNGTKEIPVNLTDVLGNNRSFRVPFTIYQSSDQTPDLFTLDFSPSAIGGHDFMPIDQLSFLYAPGGVYYQIVYFDAVLRDPSQCPASQVDIMHAELAGSCAASSTVFLPNKVLYPDQNNQKASGFLQLGLLKDYIEEGWNVYPFPVDPSDPCTLALVVRCGGNVYSSPEQEILEFNFTITQDATGGTPPEKLIDTLDGIRDKWDSHSWLSDAEKFVKMSQRFCRVRSILTGIDTAINGVGAAIGGIAEVFPPLEPVEQAIGKFETLFRKIHAPWAKLDWFLGVYCGVMTCQITPWMAFGEKNPAQAVEQFQQKFNVAGNRMTTLDYAERSFYYSVFTMCIPAILHNLHRKRQAECFRVFCHQNLTRSTWTHAQCEQQYGYYDCLANAGGLDTSEILAIVNIFNPFDDIIRAITNPGAATMMIARIGSEAGCADTKNHAAMWLLCIPYLAISIGETVALLTQLGETLEHFSDKDTYDHDFCVDAGIGT